MQDELTAGGDASPASESGPEGLTEQPDLDLSGWSLLDGRKIRTTRTRRDGQGAVVEERTIAEWQEGEY